MNREIAQKIEDHFHALPNVTARRAFVLALQLMGHKFIYWDKRNGDQLTTLRMYADDGNDFKD